MNRKHALALGVSASAALAAALPKGTSAHNLPAGTFGSVSYTAALEAKGGTKAVFQSPNVEANVKQGGSLNHLLAIQLKNCSTVFNSRIGYHPATCTSWSPRTLRRIS